MPNWKPINGYEGLYEVSDEGEVMSLKYYGGSRRHLMKFTPDKDGYLQVGLYKDKKCKKRKVHRLVAEAYLPNPNNYDCINHKNENKTDNRAENIEWCSKAYNNAYGERVKTIPQKKKRPIVQKTLAGEPIKVWESASDAGRTKEYTQSGISLCLTGRNKTYKGFLWQYAD